MFGMFATTSVGLRLAKSASDHTPTQDLLGDASHVA
jgi:hypothetical protein